MNLTNLINVLFVNNIDISKDFYINILAQTVKLDFGKNIIFESGFAIWEINPNHVISQHRKLNNVTSNNFELCFETDNIYTVYKKLQSYQVNFLHPINTEVWGQQTIRFFDPDNHLIEIGETLETFVIKFYNKGLTVKQVSESTHVPVEHVEQIVNQYNNFEISLANLNDLPDILTLQKECYNAEAELYNNYNIQPLTQNLNMLELEFSNLTILKLTINNKIIASVRAYSANNTCYVGKLIVNPQFQNKGYAIKLMHAIEEKFKHCIRFELFSGSKSEKNLYLYNKLGYTEFKREIMDNINFVYLEKNN